MTRTFVVALLILVAACRVETTPSPSFDAGGSGGTGAGSGGAAGASGAAGSAGTGGSSGASGDAAVDARADSSMGGRDASIDAGDTDAGGDAGADAEHLPCGMECPEPTPVCDGATMTCVECLGSDDCVSGVCDRASHTCVMCTATEGCQSPLVCDRSAHACVECNESADCLAPNLARCSDGKTCVQCLTHNDCPDPSAPRCNGSNQCVACNDDTQCEGKSDGDVELGVCSAGTCVQCTTTTESVCDGTSCNAATERCTATPVRSVGTCEVCLADSECMNPQARCVPMSFQGAPRPNGYCLRAKGNADCNRPLTVLINAASLSGASAANYCGLDQSLTSCEAVLDGFNGASCEGAGGGDGDPTLCGAPGLADALCETVNGTPNRCTYACGGPGQCPNGQSCTLDDPYCH